MNNVFNLGVSKFRIGADGLVKEEMKYKQLPEFASSPVRTGYGVSQSISRRQRVKSALNKVLTRHFQVKVKAATSLILLEP